MQQHIVNGHLKNSTSVTGQRFVVKNGTVDIHGRTMLTVETGSADVTRATGVMPFGVTTFDQDTTIDADKLGGDRPFDVVVGGEAFVIAAVELDPTNPAHDFVTSDAVGDATPATVADDFIGGRFIGTMTVAAGKPALILVGPR